MIRIRSFALALFAIALPLGCMAVSGGDASMMQEAAQDDWGGVRGSPTTAASAPESKLHWAADGIADFEMDRRVLDKKDTYDGDGGDVSGRESGAVTSAVEGRKLIRTGNMSVVVDDYEPFQAALEQRLKEMGGFIADANLSHYSGRASWATLTVRLPSSHFETFVGWTEEQVEVQSLDIGTQDVTAEWVDVRSRIDNGKRTEQRLLELLQDRTADLEDVLAVERELARVRGEIEAAEGQMRVLADQVELATLTLSVSVRNPYEPAVESPGFGHQIVDTFGASIDAMVVVGKGLVLLATATAPWLLLAAIGLYFVYRVLRALLRRKSS